MKEKFLGFNANIKIELDESLPKISVVPQDIGRVLLILINNTFQAIKDVDNPKGLAKTRRVDSPLEVVGEGMQHQDHIKITISDNGPGIADDIKDKIFQPFFTTKPAGQGTGLGLSFSYNIIKAHGGTWKVKTQEGTGTKFIIILPINK